MQSFVLRMTILDLWYSIMPGITDHADYFSEQVARTRRFFLPGWRHRARDTLHLGLAGGGCEWCAPDFVVDRERLPFLAFEFVSRGRGTVRLGKESHELSAGHAFFYDTQTPHVIRSDAADPMVKYFFNFAGARASALMKEWDLKAGTVIRVLDAARVVNLLEEVIDHAVNGAPSGIRSAAIALEHALALCAGSRQPDVTKFDPAYATYLRCRGHLLRNYPVLSTISQAARNCHVSPSYFTRLFQRFDMETPLGCLTRLKVSQATLRLRQNGAQVKAVASELGYKSAAHFSRVFKAWTGKPPAAVMRG